MNVWQDILKSCRTQNKSVFWHCSTHYQKSGTTEFNPLYPISPHPTIIKTPKSAPSSKNYRCSPSLSLTCEGTDAQKVNDLPRDTQLLSGSAKTGTQICLPSQHLLWTFQFLRANVSSGNIRGEEELPVGKGENVKHSNHCWTWSWKYQESSGFHTGDLRLKIF